MQITEKTDTEKLDYCPFCGAAPGTGYKDVTLRETKRNTTGYGLRSEPYMEYRVKCGNCGAEAGRGESGMTATGRIITEEEARQIAIDKWNRRSKRPGEDPQQETNSN